VSWIGLVIAAILHGLNDWSRVNGHWLWIVATIVSGILFLGYAKVGSLSDQEVPGRWPPALGRHGLPPERRPPPRPGPPGPGGNSDRPGMPAGSAAGPQSTMVRGWTNALAS
jgi:hypothetical protein